MKIELINCEISVGYIGTRREIAVQMAINAVDRFMDWAREFANRVSYAVSKTCERFVECMNSHWRICVKPVKWPRKTTATE